MVWKEAGVISPTLLLTKEGTKQGPHQRPPHPVPSALHKAVVETRELITNLHPNNTVLGTHMCKPTIVCNSHRSVPAPSALPVPSSSSPFLLPPSLRHLGKTSSGTRIHQEARASVPAMVTSGGTLEPLSGRGMNGRSFYRESIRSTGRVL